MFQFRKCLIQIRNRGHKEQEGTPFGSQMLPKCGGRSMCFEIIDCV
jgi:hypothetical protein